MTTIEAHNPLTEEEVATLRSWWDEGSPRSDERPVTITNFNMPFWALVGIMLKIVFASIPALAVLLVILAMMLFAGFTLVGGFLLALAAG